MPWRTNFNILGTIQMDEYSGGLRWRSRLERGDPFTHAKYMTHLFLFFTRKTFPRSLCTCLRSAEVRRGQRASTIHLNHFFLPSTQLSGRPTIVLLSCSSLLFFFLPSFRTLPSSLQSPYLLYPRMWPLIISHECVRPAGRRLSPAPPRLSFPRYELHFTWLYFSAQPLCSSSFSFWCGSGRCLSVKVWMNARTYVFIMYGLQVTS